MEIRLLRTDDAEACNALHNKFSHNKRSLDQWRWDFDSGLYQTDQLPFAVADDDGRIVGTQAFIPIRFIDRDGVYWTAKSEETLVDPDYRGQKLFERMYELLFGYAEERSLRYVWGFTPATKAFLKLGFKIPCATEQLLFPFHAVGISNLIESRVLVGRSVSTVDRLKMIPYRIGAAGARLTASAKFGLARRAGLVGDSLDTRIVEAAPDGCAELCRRFVGQYGGPTIYRDEAYLEWRIFNNPYTKPIMRAAFERNTLVGWIIYSIGDENVGYIVDVMAATPDNATLAPRQIVKRLLVEALDDLRRTGIAAARGWCVTNHPFDKLVREVSRSLGFFHVRRGHAVVVLGSTPEFHDPLDDSFSDWYVTRIFTEGVAG
ncbi:MAG: GNAT family N-acetyltransferase [candidate division Zixibacteria bacterium]|jgi:GNAT superfamily N-acetyltransferase|nr:GNAT family N-acetyltransferase [candidate division Zixibacteria bacterium]